MSSAPPVPPPFNPQVEESSLTVDDVAVSESGRQIEGRLRQTGRQVKLVDLSAGIMALMAGALSYVLVVALIDHWVIDLGVIGRAAALAGLILGVIVFLIRWLVPLFFRQVNPLFAARSIEQTQPTLKNSLINFLQLQRERTHVSSQVLEAIEHRAAADITNIRPEATVDRAPLIRIGYVLAAVFIVCALYTALSPKSIFQTVRRVASPFAAITRPARVQIEEIEPGDAEIYLGQQLDVSARVRGAAADEPVTLFYSTADGQTVDQPIVMRLADDRLRHECLLPESEDGAQQDLTYRIEAGDAVSKVFHVRVLPAPFMEVKKVRYDFPKYTRLPPAEVESPTEIEGLEGARVTVFGEANLPIDRAFLELAGGEQSAESATDANRLRRGRIEMSAEGQQAKGDFRLEVLADRATSKYERFVTRFVTPNGVRNERPVVHPIVTLPDLAPEVELLAPRRAVTELPQNGRLTIEVRAVDPDFGLTRVDLHLSINSAELVSQPLLSDTAGKQGPVVEKFLFEPASFDLEAGDIVECWATAADNRHAGVRMKPAPNVDQSTKVRIEIVPPRRETDDGRNDQPQSKDSAEPKKDPQQNEQKEEGDEEEGGGEKSPENNDGAGEESSPNEQGEGEQSQEGAQQENSDTKNGAGENAGQTAGEPGQEDGQQGGQGASDDGQQGSGAKGNSKADGAGDGEPSDGPSESVDGGGDGQGQRRPVASDGTEDGEAFEEIQDYLNEKKGTGEGQEGDGQGQKGDSEGRSAKSPSEPNDVEGERTDDASDGESTSGPTEGEGNEGAKPDDPSSSATSDDAAPKTGEKSDSPAEGKQSSEKRGEGERGEGDGEKQGKPDDALKPSSKEPSQDSAEKPNQSPGQGDNGDAGAGQQTENPDGAPEAQEANRQRDKSKSPGEKEAQDGQEAKSPSGSKRQSDSEGDQDGDKSGGGGEGGGQSSKAPGQDSAGGATPSDEGAGSANEPGQGETSSEPGQKKKASDQTGAAGAEEGDGSSSEPGQGKDGKVKPSGSQSEPTDGALDGRGRPDSQGNSKAPPSGGASSGADRQLESKGPSPGEDAANLEYAREATDLVLDELEHQQETPDQELLDRLGWTKQELQEFVSRWKKMKQAAGQEGQAAKEERDEALQSLGLRPPAKVSRGAGGQDDDVRGLRVEGHRTRPPSKYQRYYDAFLKGER